MSLIVKKLEKLIQKHENIVEKLSTAAVALCNRSLRSQGRQSVSNH